MDEHTYEKLEFDRVLEELAGCCGSGLGADLVRRIRPSRSPTQIRRWLSVVMQLIQREVEYGLPPTGGISDIHGEVRSAGKANELDSDGLARIQSSLATTLLLRAWLQRLPDEADLLKNFLHRIVDLTPVVEQIDHAIDSRGKVRDRASDKLASIRAAIESARNQIDAVFKRILKQRRFLRWLQYPSTTFHNERMVLPLKAEQQGRIPGIVHRSSQSGGTLFVEPAEAVELNNTIARLRVKEHDEISRILTALAMLVHQHAEEIHQTLDAAAVLDLTAAKVRYARKFSARCPEISDDGVLDLHGARHPVLLQLHAGSENEVVPIDVRLNDDFDLLVITGPNTGGKTVTLKTVGLITYMTQSGIPVPVDAGSRVPVFKNIFIDVGDEQSIAQSLSTFSAHCANILAMLKKAGRKTLVLLDELGAGTDPDEGAAIGWAIMHELLRKQCSAIVTTHLSQLKAVAFCTQRVDNASVEFDNATLRPTYVLRIGEPGNSNAIAIAQRLGMPRYLVEEARSRLAGSQRALTQAIEGTLDSRRRAEEARKQAVQARQEARQMQNDFEQKSRELEQAHLDHREYMEWLNQLSPGDTVYLKEFRKNARVVRMQLHKQSALVSVGAIDMEVSLTTIAQPDPEPHARKP